MEWWRVDRELLLNIVKEQQNTPVYVYSEKVIRSQCEKLKSLKAVSRFFYAIKANNNEDVLKIIHEMGFGFECVSPGEIKHILKIFPNIDRKRILFTPNFVPKEEYQYGFSQDVIVNVDSLYPLEHWPEVFRGRSIYVRIDPGTGRGHHEYVKTAGKQSKFGIGTDMASTLSELVQNNKITITGLHAHVGSGILTSTNWSEVANCLYGLKKDYFPTVKILNLGGGFGVVQNPNVDKPLDISIVDTTLREFKNSHQDVEIIIEPGRYLVAEAGVLLCSVTQIKKKEAAKHFIGVNAGFNSLIRPILYSAYHHCVNLTRITDPLTWTVDIVGIICESGDVLASNRIFPVTKENDVILLSTAGAYGRTMSNNYNLRDPAKEYFLREQKSKL